MRVALLFKNKKHKKPNQSTYSSHRKQKTHILQGLWKVNGLQVPTLVSWENQGMVVLPSGGPVQRQMVLEYGESILSLKSFWKVLEKCVCKELKCHLWNSYNHQNKEGLFFYFTSKGTNKLVTSLW